jgi:chromatin remodeling complex protein RSC6
MAAKNNALNKPVTVSPALEGVIGKGPLTRAEVTSKVWAYIKANGLQDSVNKRNINPDGKLAEVTGKDQITMFQLTSLVSKHLS